MNPKVSVAVACWGHYWSRVGQDFIASMESARPAEVVIVTNDRISVPGWFTVKKPASSVPMWDWFNEAVVHCKSPWIVIAGVDDIYFESAFHDLDTSGDAVTIGMIENGQVHHSPGLEHWNHQLLRESTGDAWYPTVVRREVLLKYPWRRVVYPDWIQVLEFRYGNIDLRFDQRPRFEHRMFPGNHSYTQSPIGYHQVRYMKRLLQTGLVIPGSEWPPRGGDWPVEPQALSTKEMILDLRRRRNLNQ